MSGTVRVVQFNLIKSRVSTGVECPRLFVQCLTDSFLGRIEVNYYKTLKNYLVNLVKLTTSKDKVFWLLGKRAVTLGAKRTIGTQLSSLAASRNY